MVGGEPALIERCRPVFQTSAKTIVPTGPLGSGWATKLCNNLINYLEFLAGFKAFRLAQAANVPREVLAAVTQANGVMTPLMEAFLSGLAAPATEATIARRQGFVVLAEKDLAITLDFARELGVPIPATALCSQLMAAVAGLKERRTA